MASFKYDLPLLDRDSGFSLWQVKMRALLAQMDLDDALLGHDKMPSSWTRDDKKRKDRKALSHIHLHLSNNILQEVLTKKTALEQICMTKDLTSKMLLKQKLFSHKLQEGGSMMDHLQVFKEIVSNLQSMEIKYDGEDLGLILLCSLPSSYSNFRDTILYSRDTLTLEEVYEALHAKEKLKHMVSSEGSSSQAEGLIIRGRQHDKNTNNNQRGRNSGNNRSNSKSRNWKPNNKYCKYCKKEGHDISECFKLKNKEKKAGTFKPKNNPNDDGKATFDADENSEGEVLVAYVECTTNDKWSCDSTCTFNISPNKEWFISYKCIQGGSVLMGDNASYKIEGIGSIQVKMFDGAIRTLEDVRHVPGMKRNLIFFEYS
ncbi:putative polyprotein [Tanacetum coccineum]